MTARRLAGLSLFVYLYGCSALQPKTVNDVAQEACQVAFAIDADRIPNGQTVQEFCELHENLRPFIDHILAAKRIAGAKSGISSDPSDTE